jgi:DNA polymerase-3 subunit epsilon
MNEPLVVIDFETTGLRPGSDRVIEAAAVVIEDGRLVQRFQSLANPGIPIPSFIAGFTGITNAMIAKAPPTHEVMASLANFVGNHRLAAHNATFDRGFLAAELRRIGRTSRQDFLCTLLLSRRIIRGLPSYKLEAVARYCGIPIPTQTHRALADAEMAAALLLTLSRRLKEDLRGKEITAELLTRAQLIPPADFPTKLKRLALER